MSSSDDPLAPPPGYGQAAGRSGAQEEPAGDFSMCCTGCGSPSLMVLTLGCTAGEHVGEFGYCLPHSRGPFYCGRCQEQKPKPSWAMVAMKVLRQRWLAGEPAAPETMGRVMKHVFDKERP